MSDEAWWPAGADEQLVRECNCEFCNKLIARLDGERTGQPSLVAFAGGPDE